MIASVPVAESESYARLRRALAGERLPAAFVDLDALDRNLERHMARVGARHKTLRVASKSVRVVAVLRRLLGRGSPTLRGLMCFAAREAEFLAKAGFDDLLVAYPVWQESDLDAAVRLAREGKLIRLAADSREGVERVARRANEHGATLGVVLCVDMSLRGLGGRVHLGVRRSPLHGPDQVLALARYVRDSRGVRLDGLLAYEAQIAGLGDDSPFEPWQNPLKGAIRRVSAREIAGRRRAMVEALERDGFSLPLVNGGGTGSLDTTLEESSVTEVTAGSGFFKPHLFDYYKSRHVRSLEPASFFALEVTRRPALDMVTCLGGGYVASGAPGPDKVPLPWLPRGLSLLPHEMCGEVQTPLALGPGVQVALGDPIVFRPAKAGEPFERFTEVLLLSGDRVVDRAPTYRGEGLCFF